MKKLVFWLSQPCKKIKESLFHGLTFALHEGKLSVDSGPVQRDTFSRLFAQVAKLHPAE